MENLIEENQSAYEHFCSGCDIDEECPGADGSLDDVTETLVSIREAFIKIIGITNVLSDVIACERVNSIYVDLIYVAACTDLPYALTWMFAMLLIFSSLGMTIITLRAAILPPKKASDYYDATTNVIVVAGETAVVVDETNVETYKIGNEVTALTVQKVR